MVELTPVTEILAGIDSKDLVSLKEIMEGHTVEFVKRGIESANPKMFGFVFFYGDYLLEAARFLKNQIVLDLGAGRSSDVYVLSKVVGAKAYIAVEPYNTPDLVKSLVHGQTPDKGGFTRELESALRVLGSRYKSNDLIERLKVAITTELEGKLADIPVSIIAEDMLKALKRFPEESTSIIASGIDKFIVDRKEYSTQVEAEIVRVLARDGVY